MRQRKYEVGMRFGKLTLVRRYFCRERKIKFGCVVCDCGNEKEMRMSSIRKAKSCGCLTKILWQEWNKRNPIHVCSQCGRFMSSVKSHNCLEDLYQRFIKRVNKTEGCWTWTGSKFPNGYGSFCISRERPNYLAHRYSYEIHNGEIPRGLCVLHRCDVRECVNPKHLWIGTHKENSMDMVAKGRANGGLRKLNKDDVIKIRSLSKHKTNLEIADSFRVSPSNIGMIIRNKTWKT